MNKQFFFLISPTSIKEDVFFITYGTIDENVNKKLKDYFKGSEKGILIISVITDFDWFKYFVKPDTKKYQIENYFKGFEQCLSPEILNLLEVKNSFLFSNLFLIKQIISDIELNNGFIWKNYEYVPNNNTSFKDKIIVTNSFLFNLFHEDYSKSCYGVKIERNDYKSENFISHLSSEYYRFGKEEKKYTNLEHKSLNGIFSFIIEKERNEYGNFSMLKLKLVKNNSGNYFSTQIHGEKYEILREFDIVVLSSEFKRDDNRFYFVFEKSDYKIFINLLNYIDNDFRFIWIDEEYFYKKFEERVYNKIPNSIWSEWSLFGINVKVHEFYRRYSDFGTDNDTTIFFGDTKYSKLRDKKTLSVTHNPRGNSNQKNPGKYYDLEQNVFEYFFEENKYVLINFDDIPYSSGTYNCNVSNFKSLLFHKVISVPSFLIENTFVLTWDYFYDE